MSTRKANHLPTRHVTVTVIERVGKIALNSVLVQVLEKHVGWHLTRIDRAVCQLLDEFFRLLR